MDERLTTDVAEPELLVDPPCWRRMVGWLTVGDGELSGLGLVDRRGDDFVLREAYLLDQSSSASETELDAGAVSRLLEMLAAGPEAAALRVWWHSHAHEAPFWSGVDERTIDSFAPAAMISLVVGHGLRTLARLDRFSPRETAFVWVQHPELDPPLSESELDAARRELAAKVVAPAGWKGDSWVR